MSVWVHVVKRLWLNILESEPNLCKVIGVGWNCDDRGFDVTNMVHLNRLLEGSRGVIVDWKQGQEFAFKELGGFDSLYWGLWRFARGEDVKAWGWCFELVEFLHKFIRIVLGGENLDLALIIKWKPARCKSEIFGAFELLGGNYIFGFGFLDFDDF